MFFSNIKERARDRNMGERSCGWKKKQKECCGSHLTAVMDGLARSLTAFNAGLKELFKAQHTRSNRLNWTSFVSSAPRCVFCVVCPLHRTQIRLFSRTSFRVVDATPRCSSLISRHSDAQSGNSAAKEERLSSAGDFFFPLGRPRVPRKNLHAAESLFRLFVRK